MTAWIKSNPLPSFFLVTLALGLMLISLAFFTVSAFAGLLASGLSSLAGGHWLTYLKMNGARL